MTPYQFTENWFAATTAWWQELFAHYSWPNPQQRTILEIGSFEGQSAVWILTNLIRNPSDRLICIDPFTGSEEHTHDQTRQLFTRFQANIALTGKASNVMVIQSYSTPALASLAANNLRIDMAYVDGSHRAADVLLDLCGIWPLLSPGGLCICDDYLWHLDQRNRGDVLASPKVAIDAFTMVFADQIQLLRSRQNYQVAFTKQT